MVSSFNTDQDKNDGVLGFQKEEYQLLTVHFINTLCEILGVL